MVPPSIRNNLASLRRRERLLIFVWGAACWLSIVLVLLLLCGLVDWLIDRQRDTPLGVRLGMFFVQAAVAAVAGLLFVLWPQVRRLPDALLALWVEEKIPQFEHRLISAVQLNQPDAQLDGMSKELVAVVTREAEKQTQHVGGFAQVADHSRLKWTAFVLMPIVLLVVTPFAIWPGVCFALLARQALLPFDVPHSVTLESISPAVWPIGESIPIQYRVKGAYSPDMIGALSVTPEGQSTDSYELKYVGEAKDGDGAIFGTYVSGSSVNVIYSARLVDGRTKAPSEMQVVPRPIVTDSLAWEVLPAFCGLRSAQPGLSLDDRRYEVPQGRGDVAGIRGSSVRVHVKVQKEITDADIEMLEAKSIHFHIAMMGAVLELDEHLEFVKEKKKMAVGSDRKSAEAKFDLAKESTGYRIVVRDEHGFENVPAPRRTLRLVDEAKPRVALLRDTFSDSKAQADSDGETFAVPLGGRIRVPYECYGPYGLLGEARLYYRVLKKHDSESEPVADEPWNRLTLKEDPNQVGSGPFDPKTGVFQNTPFNEQVPYYAVPSPNPDKILGKTSGGGRYFLETKKMLIDKLGKERLRANDQIEYYVKVYAANYNDLRKPEDWLEDRPGQKSDDAPDDMRLPFGVSERRVSTVMGLTEFLALQDEINRERDRVKELLKKETEVFSPK